MQKLIIFFILVSQLTFEVFSQQSSLEFHSEIEQEIISSYLGNTHQDMLATQLIADKNLTREDIELFRLDFEGLVAHFKKKQAVSGLDERFLSFVFYKTHRKLLKRYHKFSSLSTLFETGKYDCLSATTLYAMLYNELGVPFEVIEMNHHIYLKLNSPEGTFLIESTDPINGFIVDKTEINKKLTNSSDNGPSTIFDNKDYYQFSFLLNESIDINKLAGLQYYNKAVMAFNKNDVTTAVKLLEKADVFYQSRRFKEFGILLVDKLYADESLDEKVKNEYRHRIQRLARVEFIVAAR